MVGVGASLFANLISHRKSGNEAGLFFSHTSSFVVLSSLQFTIDIGYTAIPL